MLGGGVFGKLFFLEQARQTGGLCSGVRRVFKNRDRSRRKRQRVHKGKLFILQDVKQGEQDFVGALLGQQVAVELDGKGHAVDYQSPSVAVVNAAARRRHGDGAVDPPFTLLAVALPVDNLQIGQSSGKEQGKKNRKSPQQDVAAFVLFVKFCVATIHGLLRCARAAEAQVHAAGDIVQGRKIKQGDQRGRGIDFGHPEKSGELSRKFHGEGAAEGLRR